ncbi:MAG TPA: SIMPL domain-containing protein [Candidatus Staskawiczbacteria bacterium]|nr:SIMPL domain-containing protein [Candidatus Staskawiczbacteria bacterium]
MEEKTAKFSNKIFVLASVLVVGTLVFFAGQMILENKSINQQNNYQISVSGEGKVYAKPDVALVSLGVTTQAETVADATKTGTEKMNAVIDGVKGLGVDEKDIQTTDYNLSPVYSQQKVLVSPMVYNTSSAFVDSTPEIVGYKLTQNVQVKIRDFTKIGDILSKATEMGSNQIGDLQFTIDNPEQFKDQARAQAIAQAKAKAESLANESGIKLGKLINVYESNYYAPSAYNSVKSISQDAVGYGGAAPTIQPGQQEVYISISLVYQVR